jgi:hypothetical protein
MKQFMELVEFYALKTEGAPEEIRYPGGGRDEWRPCRRRRTTSPRRWTSSPGSSRTDRRPAAAQALTHMALGPRCSPTWTTSDRGSGSRGGRGHLRRGVRVEPAHREVVGSQGVEEILFAVGTSYIS